MVGHQPPEWLAGILAAFAGATDRHQEGIYRELGLQLRNETPKRRVKAKLRGHRRNAT